MTKRLQYPTYWASGGTATDPDLDTTAPSFVADKYEKEGWVSEKPPEQWQNFLSQITDEKIIGIMIDGIAQKDGSVTYQDGSIYRSGDKFCRIEGGTESEVLDIGKSVYKSLIAAAKVLIDNHLATTNPHKDTVNTLVDKSYIKTDVDSMFGSATDPKTIVYHKLRNGVAVHGETATSIGSVDATGGTFTGDVIFLDSAIIQVSPSQSMEYNRATAIYELVNGTVAIGIDAAGNGFITGAGGSTLIMSESNYDALNIKYNNSFALPIPIFSFNFETALGSAQDIGNWTVETPVAPSFIAGSGLLLSTGEFNLLKVSVGMPHTIVVRGANGTAMQAVKDVTTALTTYANVGAIVTASGQAFTHVKQIYIYPQLTARQKTMLVNK